MREYPAENDGLVPGSKDSLASLFAPKGDSLPSPLTNIFFDSTVSSPIAPLGRTFRVKRRVPFLSHVPPHRR